MFGGLTEKLANAFKKFRSKGKLTEADVKEGMREVKLALLEADVNFKVVKEFIKSVTERGGRLAAICAAPLVLGRRGLLDGKRATCYPGFESELRGAVCTGEAVVTDGRITTSRGMGTALAFAKELVSLAVSPEKARELGTAIME